MRYALAVLLTLAFTLATVQTASADSTTPRYHPGATVTVPLKDGGKIVVTSEGGPVIGRGYAIHKLGDPADWVSTTVTVSNCCGQVLFTYNLTTNFYWDGGTLLQVSQGTTARVYWQGWQVASNDRNWYWTQYPVRALSWARGEFDYYQWVPILGYTFLVRQCVINIEHTIDGFGGKSWTWNRNGSAGC